MRKVFLSIVILALLGFGLPAISDISANGGTRPGKEFYPSSSCKTAAGFCIVGTGK